MGTRRVRNGNCLESCRIEVVIWKFEQDRKGLIFMQIFRKGDKELEIIANIAIAVITPVLGYIVWLLKNQKKDRDANSQGTMLLLRVQMIEYHSKWMERGYVTRHGLENFIEMYDAYHTLGGNGMVTKMLEEIKKLPIRD